MCVNAYMHTHKYTYIFICLHAFVGMSPQFSFCAITQTPETGYITKNGKLCHKITVLAHLMVRAAAFFQDRHVLLPHLLGGVNVLSSYARQRAQKAYILYRDTNPFNKGGNNLLKSSLDISHWSIISA